MVIVGTGNWRENLWAEVLAANGSRRTRIMSRVEFDEGIDWALDMAKEDTEKVRFYPLSQSFVPYERPGKAVITCVQVDRGIAARAFTVDAHRYEGCDAHLFIDDIGL